MSEPEMTGRKACAALFDLDGVLIDTEPIYTQIWSDINREYPTGVEDFALKIKGSTLPRILSGYYPDPATAAAVAGMLAEREENMTYPLFDGVMDFLAQLKEAGIPTAIVTSSGDAKMRRLFARTPGFRAMFSQVLTDSSVSRSKPDPQGYLLAAKLLGVPAGDCYVFEDSYNGLRAGMASGATVIALSTSNPAESLEGMSHAVIPSFVGFTVQKMLSVRR